jgi:hypothetical protein
VIARRVDILDGFASGYDPYNSFVMFQPIMEKIETRSAVGKPGESIPEFLARAFDTQELADALALHYSEMRKDLFREEHDPDFFEVTLPACANPGGLPFGT